MAEFDLKGLGVALITPFTKSREIDYISLAALLDRQMAAGTDYLVVLGTTAETPSLSNDERKQLREFVVRHCAGRIPLVLGLGGNNTMALVEQLKTDDLSGYSAILSVVPYYNKPSQEGIYQHYKTLAEASPVPVILYNVPGRTGVNMLADTTLRLAKDFDNIIGVKEASGNLAQIEDIIRRRPQGFSVVSGDDGLTYPLMCLGADGVISVAANAYPRQFKSMTQMLLDGDYASARKIHYHFSDLFGLMFRDGNPAGIKCVMNCLKEAENVLRLPLVPVTEDTEKNLRDLIKVL